MLILFFSRMEILCNKQVERLLLSIIISSCFIDFLTVNNFISEHVDFSKEFHRGTTD